jgi:hypothetical protein
MRSYERPMELYEGYAVRRGFQSAVVAVAHEMLRIVYYIWRRNEPYRDGKRSLSRRNF